MADLYILYDTNGKYIGSKYDNGPPGGYESYAAGYRKLTYEEINSMHNEYESYVYNQPKLKKLKEIHLGVSTRIFEIDGETKLSVFVKALHNDTSEDTKMFLGEPVEITINDQKVMIPFGDMILLNPEYPGTYVISLSDDRFYSKSNKYTVSVINQIQEV